MPDEAVQVAIVLIVMYIPHDRPSLWHCLLICFSSSPLPTPSQAFWTWIWSDPEESADAGNSQASQRRGRSQAWELKPRFDLNFDSHPGLFNKDEATRVGRPGVLDQLWVALTLSKQASTRVVWLP